MTAPYVQKSKYTALILLLSVCINIYADETETESTDSVTVLPKITTYISTPVVEQRQVITAEEIGAMHASCLTDVMYASGIQIKSYGAYGSTTTPSIRGFSGNMIQIIIDGVCVNSSQNGSFDLNSIDISSIESIEIVRGAFSEDAAADGGVGGTVYITTKKQTTGQHLTTDASAKTYFASPFDTGSLGLQYSGQTGENTFMKADARGTFARNCYPYISSFTDTTVLRHNSQVTDGNADAQISHFWGAGRGWTVTEGFYGGAKEIPGTETSTTTAVQQDYNNRISASVVIPDAFSLLNVKANAGWQSSNEWYDTNAEHSTHFLDTFSSALSAEYTDGIFSSNSASLPFSQSIGYNISASYLDSTDCGNVSLAGGFLKETTKLYFTDRTSLIIPVTFAFSGSSYTWVPKLGIRTDFTGWSLSADAYRLYLFPNLNQLYWADTSYACGNTDLQPEDGWGGEITADVSAGPIPFSAALYSDYYFNKIQWQYTSGKWRPVNIASAFYAGCNVYTQFKLFSCLTVQANYEYLFNRLLSGGLSFADAKRIMYTPDHTASLTASLDIAPFTCVLSASFTGKRYISNLNISYLDPYLLINLSADCRISKQWKPYIKVSNLLNVSYEETEDYPMPGISLEIGCSYTVLQ